MDVKFRWIIGLFLGLIVTMAGVGYASVDDRISRNTARIEIMLPVLYRIEAKVDLLLKERYDSSD